MRIVTLLGSSFVLALALGLPGCGEKSGTPKPGGQADATTPTTPDATPAPSDAQAAADQAQPTGDAAQAVEGAIPEAARASMNGFLEGMAEATERLKGATSQITAAAAAPEMREIIDRLASMKAEIGALPAEVQTALKAEFEAQIADWQAQLKGEVDRILANPDLAGTLGEMLRQIPSLGA